MQLICSRKASPQVIFTRQTCPEKPHLSVESGASPTHKSHQPTMLPKNLTMQSGTRRNSQSASKEQTRRTGTCSRKVSPKAPKPVKLPEFQQRTPKSLTLIALLFPRRLTNAFSSVHFRAKTRRTMHPESAHRYRFCNSRVFLCNRRPGMRPLPAFAHLAAKSRIGMLPNSLTTFPVAAHRPS